MFRSHDHPTLFLVKATVQSIQWFTSLY